MVNAKKIIERYNIEKNEKYQWNIHYQIIAEYFMTRKADFTVNFVPGQFLNRDLYDSTGVKAGNISAGALQGMVWPAENKNFRICKHRSLSNNEENKLYFDEVGFRMHEDMNKVECGFALANSEYWREEVFFGTAGIGVFDPTQHMEDCQFLFQCWDIKRMVIVEGPNGFVNRIYYEREETVEQTVLEFGKEAVSEKTRKAYDEKQYSVKVKILHAIEPRYDRDPDGVSVFDLPVSSVYIELGEDKIIKESGYDQMCVFVGRLMKNLRETYGRSFAMDALPDELEANALREAAIVAVEKLLDPPLGVIDDGRLGSTTIDTSAGAINVFNISGKIGNQPPVFPINTVGDLKTTEGRLEQLMKSISDHFLIDRLLDLNNETEMTLGEVLERQKLRAFVLNPYFTRQYAEVYTPLVHYCFTKSLKSGRLGVMPGSEAHFNALLNNEDILVIPTEIVTAMLKGQHVYDIEYLTPAVRMMQTQMASGILETWKFMNDVAQTQPEVFDNVSPDISTRLIAEYRGAPREILHSDEFVVKIRDSRQKQQTQDKQFTQQMEMAKAAGHLKGLASNPGAPGVNAPGISQPVTV